MITRITGSAAISDAGTFHIGLAGGGIISAVGTWSRITTAVKGSAVIVAGGTSDFVFAVTV